MNASHHHNRNAPAPGLLARLARDKAGNTFAMLAAAVVPVLALVGGGVDMGRAYLSQSRLQQACDAGVLATRKSLTPADAAAGTISDDAIDAGQRFFNINYSDGAYGSVDRTFDMTLEEDSSISGVATVNVPMTLMQLFGQERFELEVNCSAQTSMSNTDIMFVLDVTGSMRWTNPGDSASRINSMTDTIRAFHKEMEANKGPATRLRYGFVPYASNVNVGPLLKSDWMVGEWTYQSRLAKDDGTSTTVKKYDWKQDVLGGSYSYQPTTSATKCPANTYVRNDQPTVTLSTSPHIYVVEYTINGSSFSCSTTEGGVSVTETVYNNYHVKETYTENGTTTQTGVEYDYLPRTFDVSSVLAGDGETPTIQWATISVDTHHPTELSTYWYHGCIEERDTYQIADYNSVDLGQALDLDIDLVPTPGDPSTQWRPKFNGLGFARAIDWGGAGSFSVDPVLNTYDSYVQPAWMDDLSTCPALASKLDEMDEDAINAYLATLSPAGKTYHDIGMIWGGRLLSPTGIFADENADVNGAPTRRHLIFLTDGQTETLDLIDGAYGIEPLDRRRWQPGSAKSLFKDVEDRFAFACEEVKKRNITVWFIAFGTSLNPMFTNCAGKDKSFQAKDAKALSDAFTQIAKNIGELRITQ